MLGRRGADQCDLGVRPGVGQKRRRSVSARGHSIDPSLLFPLQVPAPGSEPCSSEDLRSLFTQLRAANRRHEADVLQVCKGVPRDPHVHTSSLIFALSSVITLRPLLPSHASPLPHTAAYGVPPVRPAPVSPQRPHAPQQRGQGQTKG